MLEALNGNFTLFAERAEGNPHIFTAEVKTLTPPSPALLDEAMAAELSRQEHDRLTAQVPSLFAVEVQRLPSVPEAGRGAALRIAAWNAERLKYHQPSVALVKADDPDILLLSEADIGMARSGNRHTVAELARDLGMSYAYGVEFVEHGLGDSRERSWHAGETNSVGFHGNALLSRLPIRDVAMIKLDDGAVWWVDAEDGQGRLGSRMAIAALVETPLGPVVAVSIHLESKTDAADREQQIRRLVTAVDQIAGDLPVVMGGDLNTKTIVDEMRDIEAAEPLFAVLRGAGYGWNGANDFAVSQRTRPDGTPEPPFARLDWLASRGLAASEPRTVPAVDDSGAAISDHDLVSAVFSRA
jgi:endonuclease/exonuclease/phosphatase family metal-dependent hydrolase